MSMCNCRNCGKWFSGTTIFDMHRTGDFERLIFATNAEGKQTKKVIGKLPCTRRCMVEAEMLAIGMKQNERGIWTSGNERPSYWAVKPNQDEPEEDIA